MDIKTLLDLLHKENISFEIIKQENPILTVKDAAQYFPIEKTVPTLVVQTEKGLIAIFTGSTYGKLDFKKMKDTLGFQKMKMADKKVVFDTTGYEPGAIPLIGLSIPCIIEKRLLDFDFVYGGTGNPLYTLKISPHYIEQLNNIIAYI